MIQQKNGQWANLHNDTWAYRTADGLGCLSTERHPDWHVTHIKALKQQHDAQRNPERAVSREGAEAKGVACHHLEEA